MCFLDGTFKTSPRHFTQILVLRTKLGNDVIPVAYAFLEDKTTSSYKQALQESKTAAPLWQPGGIVLDFEPAELNAVRSIFPDCWKQGCHFHYCQCLMRQFKKIDGFSVNTVMSEMLNRAYALPFLPVDEVVSGWLDIKQSLKV